MTSEGTRSSSSSVLLVLQETSNQQQALSDLRKVSPLLLALRIEPALTPLFIVGFGYMAAVDKYTFYYEKPAVAIILYVVGLVTCLMLTVVNLHTFCILHKYGCCFMYSLRQDVEEAAAKTNIGMVSTASEYVNSTVPEARSPCYPPPYSVSVQLEQHVQSFAAEKQLGNNF
ncbi:hypothetical protein DPMN_104687 [Dreissena polymorpha]|uniref:Uncharacterized protein n=1 Tax=Dreissena polymorpha TaxID=45954 RepID=A0A9D4HC11_DREPO|nr:hypothetical protein DPMN_104687 [Dreissena polymorpha]